MKKKPPPYRRFLVFTSAGDNANIEQWLSWDRNFDLWVTYYGEEEDRYMKTADFYEMRKGGKFPNLYTAYTENKDIFSCYEAIMVLDDDIRIDARRINRLFKLLVKHDLWLLQPSFDGGKLSHEITRRKHGTHLAFTSFIEMGTPVFSRDALEKYMSVYDPILVGWGNDWWFIDVLGDKIEGKIAIAHSIPCTNPFDASKRDGQREIDSLQNTETRRAIWEDIKKRYKIKSEDRGQIIYSEIPESFFQTASRSVENKFLNLKWRISSAIRQILA